MKPVIKVENVSKQYRLGDVGTGSIKDDLKRWRYKMMGREDPFLTVGEENDRTTTCKSDYVWALKDINFDVQQGEVLGIIGRNGAGKSTLLKILSRTTGPTTGTVKMKGRIASLLEVGTGFHGELSGRENIYLNGAIMGLRKHEIKQKLDEIIDFAGVERYIDTPVKRYSSGMYVRLAFAVAAHLEPDIMIVDEVLAVGDAEFQKKCLGKMQDVSRGEGRTILFVSHNMIALQKICSKGIWISKGNIKGEGGIGEVVNNYLAENSLPKTLITGDNISYKQDKIRLVRAFIKSNSGRQKPLISESLEIDIEFYILSTLNINITLLVFTQNEEHLLSCPSISDDGSNYNLQPGKHSVVCKVPENFFNTGLYYFSILFVEDFSKVLIECDRAFSIELEETLISRGKYLGSWAGAVRPKWNWELIK